MKTAVIPTSLSSAEDIQEAIDTLREVSRRKDISRSTLPESILALYDEGFITDAASLRTAIDVLERALVDAPRIGLILAGPVDSAHRRQLTTWFRANLGTDIIVKFSHNRSLLGGVLIQAGSHIYDWSYRSRLLDRKVSFTEVLERV